MRRIYSHSCTASERTNERTNRQRRLVAVESRASVRSYAYFSRSRGDSPAVFPPVNLSRRSRQSSVSGRLNVISASGHNGPLFSRYHSGVSVLSSLAPAALPPAHLLPVPHVSPSLSLVLSYLKPLPDDRQDVSLGVAGRKSRAVTRVFPGRQWARGSTRLLRYSRNFPAEALR